MNKIQIFWTVQRLLILIKLCNFAFNFLAPGANTIASEQEKHRRRQLWLMRLPECCTFCRDCWWWLVDDGWCSGINGAKTRMQPKNWIYIKSYQTAAEGRKQNGRRCTRSLGQQEIKKYFPTGSTQIFSRQTLLKVNQKMLKLNLEMKKLKTSTDVFLRFFLKY